jgi:hypothetical protein
MNDTRTVPVELLRQALEALMWHDETVRTRGDNEAITALCAALAQQEPMCVGCEGKPTLQNSPCAVCGKIAQQEQGPVAWRYNPIFGSPWSLSDDGYYVSCKRDKGYTVEPLYTHPPRHEWRGLTVEERRECTSSPFVADNYRAIEAKLKEKNA